MKANIFTAQNEGLCLLTRAPDTAARYEGLTQAVWQRRSQGLLMDIVFHALPLLRGALISVCVCAHACVH